MITYEVTNGLKSEHYLDKEMAESRCRKLNRLGVSRNVFEVNPQKVKKRSFIEYAFRFAARLINLFPVSRN